MELAKALPKDETQTPDDERMNEPSRRRRQANPRSAKAEPTTNSIANDSAIYLKTQSIAPQSRHSHAKLTLSSKPSSSRLRPHQLRWTSHQPGAVLTAPATQPIDQPLADARIGTLSFMCRDVTVEQAHELADMLSAKPGQSARVVEQPGQVTAFGVERAGGGFSAGGGFGGGGGGFGGRGAGFGAAPGAVSANGSGAMGALVIAPSTQPATGPSISLGQSPTTQAVDRIESDADKFNLQQQQITLSTPATQPQPQRVDLLILLCPQVTTATQPATQPADQPVP